MLSMGSDRKGRNMKVMIVLILAQTGERCAENNARKALISFKFIPKACRRVPVFFTEEGRARVLVPT